MAGLGQVRASIPPRSSRSQRRKVAQQHAAFAARDGRPCPSRGFGSPLAQPSIAASEEDARHGCRARASAHGRDVRAAFPSKREAQGNRAAICAVGAVSFGYFSCRRKKSNTPDRAEQTLEVTSRVSGGTVSEPPVHRDLSHPVVGDFLVGKALPVGVLDARLELAGRANQTVQIQNKLRNDA